VRRALAFGRDAALAMPVVLFLRALALASGLAAGTLASLVARLYRLRDLPTT